MATSPEDVLRNIVRQLLTLNPAAETTDLEAAKKAYKPLSPSESLEKIKELLEAKTSVTFVIDALDSCVYSQKYD